MSNVSWSGSRTTQTCTTMSWDAKEHPVQWVLIRSDAHHDHAACDQAFERKHLDMAKERGAAIVDTGDLHCAMQGRFDKRASRSALRREYQQGDYFDNLVEHAVNFYTPYAENWLSYSPGNHEESTRRYHETDLCSRTVKGLRDVGSKVQRMPYSGWIFFRAHWGNSRKRQTLRMHYHHGYGGGGKVNNGIQECRRKAAYIPDAHIITSGHIHRSWYFPVDRVRVSFNGKERRDRQIHITTPGYKDEYLGGKGEGYHVREGRDPRAIGAWWLRLEWNTGKLASVPTFHLTEDAK